MTHKWEKKERDLLNQRASGAPINENCAKKMEKKIFETFHCLHFPLAL